MLGFLFMDLKTATTYWRESGGEYDQKLERAIISVPALQKFVVSVIGWTLINNQDGEAFLSLKDKLRTAEQERDQYKDAAEKYELCRYKAVSDLGHNHVYSALQELESLRIKLSNTDHEA
jgi:hypothetical protein